MNDRILEHYLEEFQSGFDVDPPEAEILFDALIGCETHLLLTRVLLAWEEKGTTEDELFAFASIMRERMTRISSRHATLVDTVGTGGSSAKTFNVSTAAAFVIAGAGQPVAKHGNRAATSSSGSSDVLTLLGIEVDAAPANAADDLDRCGICFMHAPRFHSLSTTLAKARRTAGVPTIFNNLGPLCNPASAPHHVIGVANADLVDKTANVLARLGSGRSWVVRGEDGLDEISLSGKTTVYEVNDGDIRRFEITAADFGMTPSADGLPLDCAAEESAEIIRRILRNEANGENAEKLVLVNAAAALYVAEHAASLPVAYRMAEESIRSGAANGKLNILGSGRMK